MSWGRVDDRECMDAKVGDLTDGEYRARHALMQYCLREHRASGVFPVAGIIHAAFATPVGPKCVTKKHVAKYLELGLVHPRDAYTEGELHDLGIAWPEEGDWLRVHRWEKFNPPPDLTANRRQQLFRDPVLRQAIRDRDGDECRYCGETVSWTDRKGGRGGTYDHIDPEGGNTIDNLVVACRACNSRKSNRTPEEAGMRIRLKSVLGQDLEPDQLYARVPASTSPVPSRPA